jgi:hypothetical protein
MRSKTGTLVYTVRSWTNLAPQDAGALIRPLSSAGAKGARKQRQRKPDLASISLERVINLEANLVLSSTLLHGLDKSANSNIFQPIPDHQESNERYLNNVSKTST